MASGGPTMNGDISRSPSESSTFEDTVRQMNTLIQGNRDVKDAVHQTNLTMKELFEGLATRGEKQRAEREFLEKKLEEAQGRVEVLTIQNQELAKKLEGTGGLKAAASNQSAELEALRAQMARLRAEKDDLVALNSELQLKAEQDAQDDSFVEIITVSITMSSANIMVHGDSCLTLSVSLSITTANKKGLETVSLRKKQEAELEAAEMKMLILSLGVTDMNGIKSASIRGPAHVR